MIAIIAIPSAIAYTYFAQPSIEPQADATDDISDMIEQSQLRAKSDNQTTQNTGKSITGLDYPDTVIVDRVTESGIRITAERIMKNSFDPYDLKWDKELAIRSEQILKEENQRKIDKVIYEFTEGKLAYVFDSCSDLVTWYQFYYFGGGRNLDGLWSYNQNITDFFKFRMGELGCEFHELPEGNKEKLDAQSKDIQEALRLIEEQQKFYDDLYGKSD